MLQENVIIEVDKRSETGKNAANRLRASGSIPAVLYGGGREMETMPLTVPRKDLVNVLRKGLHDNAIFKLKLKGTDQQRHVMIRDLTVDKITRAILHVDFVRILMDRKLRVKSGVEVAGVASGVKNQGGLLNIVTHELEVECLPADIPTSITVDVTAMNLHDSFRVSDLKLPDGVKVLESADRVIVHIGMPKAEETVAAVAEAVPGAGEPEVIKKGKKEEDEKAAAGKAAPGKAAPAAKAAAPAKKEKK
jgi:large subunit ribosomal protein L25